MSRRSGAPRRSALPWTCVAACALSAVPAVGAMAAPGENPVAPSPDGPSRSRITIEHIETDPDPVAVGGTTTVRVLVSNRGSDRSGAPFTVQLTLPDGATAVGPYFPTACTTDSVATTVTCQFPQGMRVGRSASVLVPVQICPSARQHGNLSPGVVSVINGNDPDTNGKIRSVGFGIRTA
ncbi:hypothetical protein F7Q99_25675 [Streptomyces kaniharaensis]|uniref:DUF11 domain-containing protein n=1 Tax=Streptomyces kaniharaensis TaxID=212423 RepID=A0A6N7KZ78_9ACTN|nr:hypothetical protein [Streptomyces kaniharaensis]MQS15568.1 hypothetical protein [Streptomyces kaniharaensis]